MKRIYLAGPDVFLADAIDRGRRLKEVLSHWGLEGVYPLDNEIPNFGHNWDTGLRISVANEELIRSCDAVAANITPFRGPHADVGTAYEMGFARALGLLVCAYSDKQHMLLEDRIETYAHDTLTPSVKRDVDGFVIEQFDMIDNLMLDGGIASSGGGIFGSIDECAQYISDYDLYVGRS